MGKRIQLDPSGKNDPNCNCLGCTIQRIRDILEEQPIDRFAILNQLILNQKYFEKQSEDHNMTYVQSLYNKVDELINSINSVSEEDLWECIEYLELKSEYLEREYFQLNGFDVTFQVKKDPVDPKVIKRKEELIQLAKKLIINHKFGKVKS